MQHSTIEVAPHSGMEVVPDRSVPEVLYPPHTDYKPWEEPPQWPQAPQRNRIAGLRKATFWLLVALFAVVALALGLGTGLGLGLRDTRDEKTGASVSPTTSAFMAAESTAATASSSTSTSTGSTSTAPPTPTTLQDSGCPNMNGNTITKSSSKLTQIFKIYCDSDLTGTDQASLVVASLDECMTLCFSLNWTQNRKDVGAVWNENGVVGQTAGTCWCKGGTDINVTAKSGIVVATPLPS
ncbi:hypothetical protein F5Y13DRAFT_151104 [Hypoxylon sp. FL1857]|nr:hypothetical protein F5Y13DRAFT_151104 [Hypoxylon sp. FL1857]